MSEDPRSSRRDPRFDVRPGAGEVSFEHPDPGVGRVRGALSKLSVAGLGFEIDAGLASDFLPGTLLMGASLRIGDCELNGEISVRHSISIDDDRIEIGCLFYPASADFERQLASILTGMEAVLPPASGPA